ncbi:c-type cytochrome biogenesis protein CcsB [Luteococcus peritonei]|uniref:C-type cytochrome biogenesis protein CcsB n=1 Tax=Luteococcus peritonei TaxID=88874 RepID=A0ABW4RV01_9ACTN
MNIQELSALGIVTAAVVYLLAFMAHAAEWASARDLPVRPADRSPARERELVTAGAPSTSPAPAAGPSPLDGAQEESTRIRVDMFGRLGVGLTMIAAACHLAGWVLRGVAAHRLPWGNMYEFTISALAFVVIAYLVLALRHNMRWLGLPMTLLLAIGCGLAATVFYVAVAPLVPALHSVWFIIHIVAACIAGAAFNLGGLASIIYLFKARSEAKGATTGYLAKLPSARKMDTFAYRAHAFAFPIWTFTIAAGSIWAEYAWGRFWGWDPKETWSLVTWVVYAMYLHARATAGWKGRNAAIIAIIGVVSFWFNFIGVNLLVSGLHSYAGI